MLATFFLQYQTETATTRSDLVSLLLCVLRYVLQWKNLSLRLSGRERRDQKSEEPDRMECRTRTKPSLLASVDM